MIKRNLEEQIISSLKNFPVVGIIGPRQIGKTTLAKIIKEKYNNNTIYLDLELPSDLNKLIEPELYFNQYQDYLIIIDEIQIMPSLFPLLRSLIDKNRKNGHFLILGSANPILLKKSSESLAGRIIYHELMGLCTDEIRDSEKKVQSLWLKGGYPLSYLTDTDEQSFNWREAFIKNFLERDIPQLGIRISSIFLRKFWVMIAHSHADLWKANVIANSLGISQPTVNHYLDILESTFIIRRLLPYFSNIKKRLIKSPKVYIRDSGLLHALLKIITFDDLHSNPIIGLSWEGFIIEEIIKKINNKYEIFFYRTHAGAEIDALVIQGNKEPIAIEVKYSLTPKLSKGFWIAFKELSCKKGFVVYPGTEIYPLNNNVYCIPSDKLDEIFN